MFNYNSVYLRSDLETAIHKLLKRAADTNVFIAEESRKTLMSLCQACPEDRIISTLLSLQSTKVSSIKANICRCLQAIAGNLREKLVQVTGYDALIIIVASYITDNSEEARNAARLAISGVINNSLSSVVLQRMLYKSDIPQGLLERIISIIEKDYCNPQSSALLSTKDSKCI